MKTLEPPSQYTNRRFTLFAPVLFCLMFALSACMSGKPAGLPSLPLANVDLERMYGRWYLVATARRNWFEEGMVAPYDDYSKRSDGDIQDDFRVRRGSFTAPVKHYSLHTWVRPGTNNAHWRVQLFWPLNLPFLALYTDPEYRYVLFGEQDRKNGWMYSRSQTLPEADYQLLLDQFEAVGYDRSRFVKFIQLPEQLGKPGFWSEGIQ